MTDDIECTVAANYLLINCSIEQKIAHNILFITSYLRAITVSLTLSLLILIVSLCHRTVTFIAALHCLLARSYFYFVSLGFAKEKNVRIAVM
jgi:hypothetical protein